MTDIFVSYSHKDEERVRPIVEELEKRGWSVFWDIETPAGKTWHGHIGTALNTSHCVVVVWSCHSIVSESVIEEAWIGKQRGLLVPLRIDDIDLPLGFSLIQTPNLSDWQNNTSHQAFQILVNAVTAKISSSAPSNHVLSVTPEVTVVPPLPEIVTPQVPPTFVFIRGGEFTMGSPLYEPERRVNEEQHQVKVSDFYMGKYAVTQAEWRSVTGTNPSIFQGENLPVERVSWDDCQAFIQALNRQTGKTYRLPTEAEWEYACRAGTITPFNTGGNLTTLQANYDGNYPYNNNQKGSYKGNTVPVNSFAPNAWGFYNMHGNVWEWCSDWYDSNYYADCKAKGVVPNPENTATGSDRVIRGGSWSGGAGGCRSAYRLSSSPVHRHDGVGFRLVFVP